jgi:uncharacterized membrane protein
MMSHYDEGRPYSEYDTEDYEMDYDPAYDAEWDELEWAEDESRRSRVATGTALALGAAGLALAAVAVGVYRHKAEIADRPADSAPDRAAKETHRNNGKAVAGKTVLINRPRAELFKFWENYDNLQHFMKNVEHVETHGERSVWKIAAPAGQTVTVETELVERRENELLSWKSTENSQIETEGHIAFRDAPAGRGTYVEAVVQYKPPVGQFGRMIAKLFRREPGVQARHELKRFKMLMETGEIATSHHYIHDDA